MSKETSTAIKVVVLIFAILGVAVAALLIVKKLKCAQAEKEASLFDDLDELDIDDEDICACCGCDDCEVEEEAEEI